MIIIISFLDLIECGIHGLGYTSFKYKVKKLKYWLLNTEVTYVRILLTLLSVCRYSYNMRSPKRQPKRRGYTLIELMLASSMLVVVVMGTLQYQYFAVRHAKKADAKQTALKTALLLIEDWKSTGGMTNYDPVQLQLDFQEINNEYSIIVDELPMQIAMTTQDQAVDAITQAILRRLDVEVKWNKDYSSGPLESDNESLRLTTYVRVDQASG